MAERREILETLARHRTFFESGARIPVETRRAGLRRLLALLRENRAKVFAALSADLGKSEAEAAMTEFLPLVDALRFLIRRLPKLAAPKRVPVAAVNFPARGRVVPEPYGLVLVVAAWNYPLLLSLEPVAAALAGGNRVALRLSNRSPKTMSLVGWLLEQAYPEEVTVLRGELSFEEMLAEKFDSIFFTGGRTVGRRVLEAASAHLTPVTLELGGKSPCIVVAGADLRVAARRIVWGKFTNAGQTCVAPDYLLVDQSVADDLLVEIRRAIRTQFSEDPLSNPDYPKIVDRTAYDRLVKLLSNGRLVAGGECDPGRLTIAPTVIDGIGPEDPLMEDEIFGPILPVFRFRGEEGLFEFLRGREKPLALYCFGACRKLRNRLVRETSSGAVVFNDVVMHFLNRSMPFGGVGASGMGAYHGKYSFQTFTHLKPVMIQSDRIDWPFRYPPFRGWKGGLIAFLTRSL